MCKASHRCSIFTGFSQFIDIYIYTHIYININYRYCFIYSHVHLHMHIHMYMCIYIRAYMHIYNIYNTYICISIIIYICIHIHTCICKFAAQGSTVINPCTDLIVFRRKVNWIQAPSHAAVALFLSTALPSPGDWAQ